MLKVGDTLKCKENLNFPNHKKYLCEKGKMYEIIVFNSSYITLRNTEAIPGTVQYTHGIISMRYRKEKFRKFRYVWDHFIDVNRARNIVKEFIE